MKVAVEITVEIDPESYRAEFGEPYATAAEIREYVQRAVEGAAQSELQRLDTQVYLKPDPELPPIPGEPGYNPQKHTIAAGHRAMERRRR